MEKREPSYTVGGNVNGYSHYGTQYSFLKKLKTEVSHDPAIPLLSIYPDKTLIQNDTWAPMFIVALFTTAKTRKQLKYPSIDECIKTRWYIHVCNTHACTCVRVHWAITQPLKRTK